MTARAMSLAIIVTGLVAGCGGSGSSSSSTSSHTAASVASVSSTSSAAASSSAGASSSSGGGTSFASGGNCHQLASMAVAYYKQLNPTSGGGINLADALHADQALADASPAVIHSDAELVVHSFASYVSKLTSSGYKFGSVPTAAQLAIVSTAAHQLATPQFRSAMTHVSAWIRQNCKGVTP